MAASVACAAAARRLIALLLRSTTSELASPIVPSATVRVISSTVHPLELAASRLSRGQTRALSTNALRSRTICGPTAPLSRTAIRSFSIKSPLGIDPSRALFLSFSRRQWWFFFGSFFVMGSGTVQYMELGAIAKYLDQVREDDFTEKSLDFDTLRTADIFAGTISRVVLARNDKLIGLVCKVLVDERVQDDSKAVAAHLLGQLWDVDSGRESIVRHLNVAEFVPQYVKQVNTRDYEESMHILLTSAFATRSPSASEEEKAAALQRQRQNMRKTLPLVSLTLLEKISSDPSTHSSIVSLGAIDATLKLASVVGQQIPLGMLLFSNLSTTELGRQALLQKRVISHFHAIFTDTSSPFYATYTDHVPSNFAPIYFQALLANVYRSNLRQLSLEVPEFVHSLNDDQKGILSTYNPTAECEIQRRSHVGMGMLIALSSGIVWGAARGLVRRRWRGIPITSASAALQGSLRAGLAAPLLVGAAFAFTEFTNSMKDDRFFITWSLLSSTAIVFGLNFALAVAPFSVAPAILGRYASQMPTYAERVTKERQLDEFKQKIKEDKLKNNSVTDELDEILKDEK